MKEQLLKLQEVFTKAKGVSVELGAIDDFEKQFEKALKDNTAEKLIDNLRKAEVGFEKVIKELICLVK